MEAKKRASYAFFAASPLGMEVWMSLLSVGYSIDTGVFFFFFFRVVTPCHVALDMIFVGPRGFMY
jgi:hypothetical protein